MYGYNGIVTLTLLFKSMVTSEAIVERCFSSASLIVTEKRNRLSE